MSFLAQGQRDVLSIEAPIQWTMEGVRQVEAESGPQGPRIEPTLRAMVAVRPDVLMVSAVPDHGTAMLVDPARLEPARRRARQPPTSAARAVVGAARPRRAAAAAGRLARPRHRPAPRAPDLPHLPRARRAARRRRRWRAHGIDARGGARRCLLQGQGLPDLQHDRLPRPPRGLRDDARQRRGALDGGARAAGGGRSSRRRSSPA